MWSRLVECRLETSSVSVAFYGPTTWDVYARLDISLNPAGPESLFDTAATYVAAGQVVLDAGCRDGAHLIELVRRFDVDGVGVEPVALHWSEPRRPCRSQA